MEMDPYAILGVEPDATNDEIKRAYKSKCQAHHPDKNLDDPFAKERFQQIADAYAILKDPDKRSRHDNGQDTQEFDPRPSALGELIRLFIMELQRSGHGQIIERMRTSIITDLNRVHMCIVDCKRSADALKEVKTLISYSGSGDDFLSLSLDAEHQKCLDNLESFERDIQVMERASELLEDYKDVKPAEFSGLLGGPTSPDFRHLIEGRTVW